MRAAYVRRIDDLGRVVVPAELRNRFGIGSGEALQLSMESDRVLLHPCQTGCAMCGSSDRLYRLHGRSICSACVTGVKNMAGHHVTGHVGAEPTGPR